MPQPNMHCMVFLIHCELNCENCMLKTSIDRIGAQTPLFGPESVGLDSLDALQMTVAIEKRFGVALSDPETVRRVLQNLGTLQDWLKSQKAKGA